MDLLCLLSRQQTPVAYLHTWARCVIPLSTNGCAITYCSDWSIFYIQKKQLWWLTATTDLPIN